MTAELLTDIPFEEDMSELKSLLLNVPDSYYDFVESLMDEARKSDRRKQSLIRYLKTNPKATTSDVLMYLVDDLELYDEYKTKHASSVLV